MVSVLTNTSTVYVPTKVSKYSGGTLKSEETITYDDQGRRISSKTEDANDAYEYEYDDQGWVVTEKYTYNSARARRTCTYQDGLEIQRECEGSNISSTARTYEKDSQGHIALATTDYGSGRSSIYSVECDSNGNPVKVSASGGEVYTIEWAEATAPNDIKGLVKLDAMAELPWQ